MIKPLALKLGTILASPDSANGSGVSSFFWCIIAIIFIIRGACILRKDGTNKPCVFSLILVLIAYAGLNLIGDLGMNAVANPVSFYALAMLALLSALAGLMLAITGLCLYSSKDKGHKKGKGYAIWAIILSSLLMVVLIVSVFNQLKSSQVTKVKNQSRGVKEYAEMNFKLAEAPKRWVEIESESVNSDATVCFMSGNAKVFFMVIAENGIGLNINSSLAYADIIRDDLESSMSQISFTENEELESNGLLFQRFTAVAEPDENQDEFYYSFDVLIVNGFYYQLVLWGDISNKDKVDLASKDWVRRFSLLDVTKLATQSGEPLKDVDIPSMGIQSNLSQDGWMEWPDDIDKDRPGLILEALKYAPVYLTVDALDLEGLEPSDQQLISGMMSRQDLSWPNDKTNCKKIELADFDDAWVLQTKVDVSGDQHIQDMRIVRKNGFVYLIAVWYPEDSEVGPSMMEEAMANLKFFERSGSDDDVADRSLVQSRILNFMGLTPYNKKEFKEALKYFKLAHQADNSFTVSLINVCNAHRNLNQYKEGLEYITKHLPQNPDDNESLSYHAYFTGMAGDLDEASKMYVKLFENGYDDEDELYDALSVFTNAEQPMKSVPVIETFLERHPSMDVGRWLGLVYAEAGEYEKAIESFKSLSVKYPEEVMVLYNLGETCNRSGDYHQAEAVSEILIEKGYNGSRTAGIKGWSQYNRKWYSKAYDTFNAALELDPNNEDLIDAIKDTSSAMGKGENLEIRNPIAAVTMPAQVKSVVDNATTNDHTVGTEAYYKSYVKGTHFLKGKTQKTTRWVNALIQERSGLNRFSTITIEFNPLAESLYVNYLKVFDEKGVLVAEGKVEDYFITSDDDEQADNDKILNLPVPGLKTGYTIQYAYTTESDYTVDDFEFDRNIFARSLPQDVRCMFISGDTEDVRYVTNQEFNFKKSESLLMWSVENIADAESESYQPSIYEFTPIVITGNKNQSWDDLAKKYLERIEDRLVITDSIKSLSRDITKGLKTDLEKVVAVSNYVRERLEYKAIEFGVRGRVPNQASQILSDRYGDCKDHSLLLCQLLNASGIEANLALINDDWQTQKELPSTDQFNHMIIYLPTIGSGFFIDGTDKHLSVESKLPPTGLTGKYALVLNEGGKSQLVKVADYPEKEESIEIERIILKTEDGEILFQENVTLTGYYASYLRSYLSSSSSKKRQALVHEFLTYDERKEMKSFNISNLSDTDKPLKVELSYHADELVKMSGKSVTIKIPNGWEDYYANPSHVNDRKNPFVLRRNTAVKATNRFKMGGFQLSDKTNSRSNALTGKVCSYQISASADNGAESLVIKTVVRRHAGSFPKEEFALYEKECRAAMKAIKSEFEFTSK